jgi:predicted transcriptional regulator
MNRQDVVEAHKLVDDLAELEELMERWRAVEITRCSASSALNDHRMRYSLPPLHTDGNMESVLQTTILQEYSRRAARVRDRLREMGLTL